MSDAPRPVSEPQAGAQPADLSDLVPLLGEDNVRRMLETPITDEQCRRIAIIVQNAPRRLA
jgi:hypothetical protein